MRVHPASVKGGLATLDEQLARAFADEPGVVALIQ